jgi:hypothetical protein
MSMVPCWLIIQLPATGTEWSIARQ